MLIKDFTGVRCVNCPAAAEYAHSLQQQLGEDRIFIMSVHAGYMATPVGSFPDFTTPEGTAWYNGNSANPLFAVDHVALTEGNTLNESQLDTPVNDALNESMTFSIGIENEYDESTRQLKVKSNLSAMADYYGELYVSVCLLEDNVVGWQVVPGGVDTTYVFHNVFRGTLNGVDGEQFANGQVNYDDEFTKTNTMTIDSAFKADECYVLTYVYDKVDGKILQTAMEKVMN